MRIVVHEHFSSRPRGVAPEDLRRAGRAMRDAIAADLRALPGIEVRVPRLPRAAHQSRAALGRAMARALSAADAAFLIAPETGGILKHLVTSPRGRHTLLVSGPRAVALAADKRATSDLLRRAGIATPPTRLVPRGAAGRIRLAREALPFVLKPRDGCGAAGVGVVRRPADRGPALRRARAAAGGGAVIAQPFIEGIPVGVSLVARAGFRGRPAAGGLCVLGVSLQALRGKVFLEYAGGSAPVRGRHARVAAHAARRAAAALQRAAGDLRGPVGVDLVLTPRGAVVIEINPRLTTSFIGLRRLARINPARYLLDGAAGRPLPARAALSGACRFAAGGRVRRLRRAPLR